MASILIKKNIQNFLALIHLSKTPMVFTIAIDGPAGSGKSSTAFLLRKKLGFKNINSGNIYRAITYLLDKTFNEYNLKNEKIKNFVNSIELDLINEELFYKNENINKYLRTSKIDNNCINVAKELYVRKKVGKIQNKFVENSNEGIILEGRDIGTNILPHATLKIFLNASPEERAKRRFKELPNISYEETLLSIKHRDFEDMNREHGPLKIASDAVVINNDGLSISEVVDKIIVLFDKKIKI